MILIAKRIGELNHCLFLEYCPDSITEAEVNLARKEKELADVNAKQAAFAHIKTEFDILRPDIFLICDKLALFGAIWTSVSSTVI